MNKLHKIRIFLITFLFILVSTFFNSCTYSNFFTSKTSLSDEITNILASESLFYSDKMNYSDGDNQDRSLSKNVNNYFSNLDKYGDYFTPSEYKAFEKTTSAHYVGVGMLLYQKKTSEDILCIPINSKIKKMGISKYDQLISVNGESVKGRNFYVVSSSIRGKENTSISLQFKKSSGTLLNVVIERTVQHYKTVQHIQKNGIEMIKIVQFTKDTANELISMLEILPYNMPIIIDLTDNGGGDFVAAIESADLFLPKGTRIASLKTTTAKDNYYALNKDYTKGKKVILLQNEYTASAAEVFIAGLTENYRATSIGSKSYGKGVAQKIVSLSNGGAIIFTYAKLISPSGNYYDRQGLLPTTNLQLYEFLREENY